MWTQNWQAYQFINERDCQREYSEKMNKYHCPEDCESLTEVCVNQAVRDHLSPSAHVRSEGIKMQKVLFCLKAYVP